MNRNTAIDDVFLGFLALISEDEEEESNKLSEDYSDFLGDFGEIPDYESFMILEET